LAELNGCFQRNETAWGLARHYQPVSIVSGEISGVEPVLRYIRDYLIRKTAREANHD
jgi:hypothetical protein